ncbi:MAG: hypothetical protein QOH48_2351, partial [Actinomycetota bacterium]|nr:hypothetical protein [Actinomycetota bacterium]
GIDQVEDLAAELRWLTRLPIPVLLVQVTQESNNETRMKPGEDQSLIGVQRLLLFLDEWLPSRSHEAAARFNRFVSHSHSIMECTKTS